MIRRSGPYLVHGVRRRLVALTASGATVLALAACGSGAGPQETGGTARPAAVALHAKGAPSGLRIGVVLTLTSAPGQGADWSSAAEGAQVAAYRYGLGGTDVTIVPANDKGTSAGARSAVAELVRRHVAGIVFASDGSHVGAGLVAAHAAHLAALLPYATETAPSDATWSTGPDDDQIGGVLQERLTATGATHVLVIDTGETAPAGVTAAKVVRFHPGDDTGALVNRVARLRRTQHVDAVLVTGDAATQATVVAALQGRAVTLPIFLTPAALSPGFGADLDRAGGALTAVLTSAGTPDVDTAAMSGDATGAAASAYLAALRAAAESPTLKDFFDDQPFQKVAADADARSHDAVIALVTAAARAKSADPAKVLAALRSLTATSGDGLAGPRLDFAHQQALDSDAVVAVESTTQSTGLRPTTSQPRLSWYAAPAG